MAEAYIEQSGLTDIEMLECLGATADQSGFLDESLWDSSDNAEHSDASPGVLVTPTRGIAAEGMDTENALTDGEINALPKADRAGILRDLYARHPTRALEYLSRKLVETVDEGWCRNTKMTPTKEGGYVQMSSCGANKFATLQQVLA